MSTSSETCCVVLIAEDEAIIGMTLKDDLQDAGYLVVGPIDCRARALALLESVTPDLAVVDTKLKDGSSEGLAAELNRRGVPFVVYSGYRRDKNTAREFMDAVWVEKPATSGTLLEVLAGLRAAPTRLCG